MPEAKIEEMNAGLANTCAELLKMALTAARVHAGQAGRADLVESAGRLEECRLVIHARGHDLSIEVLSPGSDGGTVRLFALTANSAPAWTLQ